MMADILSPVGVAVARLAQAKPPTAPQEQDMQAATHVTRTAVERGLACI